jgi:hypothetical protein
LYWPPIACEASSMTLKPYCRLKAWMGAMSQGWPQRCTGITIFGNLPARLASSNFSARRSTLRLQVSGSMSTKSTCAPQYKPQLELAAKVVGVVHSQSPGPRPRARHATCSALVALLTATACSAPQ